jgi:hypothetical protein
MFAIGVPISKMHVDIDARKTEEQDERESNEGGLLTTRHIRCYAVLLK